MVSSSAGVLYLSADILRGCDALGQAQLAWDGKRRVMLWGNAPYVVNHIPRQINKVERVKPDPPDLSEPSLSLPQIHLHSEKLPPYQIRFVSVTVKQEPGTTLLVYPQPRFSHNSHPFLVEVNRENAISLPLIIATKCDKTFKPGTILGSCEKVDLAPSPQVNVTQKIHNDLIPQTDQVKHQSTRVHKLRELIKSKNWQHLTRSEQTDLRQLILQHDPQSILDEKELGFISGPPAYIKADDPCPSRGPTYRYPEQAK